jgi:hypothetical protein
MKQDLIVWLGVRDGEIDPQLFYLAVKIGFNFSRCIRRITGFPY